MDRSHREAQQSLGISLKLTSGGVQNVDLKEITYTHTIFSWGLIVLYVNLLPLVMMSTIATVLAAPTFEAEALEEYILSKDFFGFLLQITNRPSLLKVLRILRLRLYNTHHYLISCHRVEQQMKINPTDPARSTNTFEPETTM